MRKSVVRTQQAFTCGDLWKLWLDDRAKDALDGSNEIYKANWVSLGAYFANKPPHLLTHDDGRIYAKGRFAQGIAQATVSTELVRMRACLNWATKTKLIEQPQMLWAPGAGKSRKRVLSREEANRLIHFARLGDPHIFVFVVLAFSTGGRHTALLDLEWTRVNFQNRTINLEIELPPAPMSKRKRKGRADVVMARIVYEALTEAFVSRTCEHVVEHGGHRLTTVKQGFANAVARAGLSDDITPHTIRHTVATWASEANVNVKHTAHMLGHADENTTRGVYTHNSAEASRPAIDAIDLALASLPIIDGQTGTNGDQSDHASAVFGKNYQKTDKSKDEEKGLSHWCG